MKKIYVLILAGFLSCYYDATPPDPSELNDSGPRLILSMDGFTPASDVYVRFWDKSAKAYPLSYGLKIDAGGSFQLEIVTELGTTSAGLFVFVDENQDGVIDAADYGNYTSGIVVSDGEKVPVYLNYSAGTLAAYTSVAGNAASGQKICIYMPVAEATWSTSLIDNIPEYPKFNENELELTAWGPVSIFSTAALTQTVALPPGNYDETCITDTNSNDKYDSGETVSTTAGITVP